ncbi:MAG: nicotinamide mononucleotide transporter [Aureispira sp.]|nr:nicotinamide mononucleotide transporter [Aureispira sp.]
MQDSFSSLWDWIWLIFPLLNAIFLIAMLRQIVWGWLPKILAFILPFLLYNNNWSFSSWGMDFLITQLALVACCIWGFYTWQQQGIGKNTLSLGGNKQGDDLLDNLAIEEPAQDALVRRMPLNDQVLVAFGILAIILVLIVLGGYTSYRYSAWINASAGLEIGALYLFAKRYVEAWMAVIAYLAIELYTFSSLGSGINMYTVSTFFTLILAIYGLTVWWQAAQKHSL